MMKNGCRFWQLVTQPDQILEWLCGLCRPTGKADGPHGGCKGWTWLYRGPEWVLLSQLAMGCVTCHACHGCVTDFRPILGNPMEVTHVTSPGHVYILPC